MIGTASVPLYFGNYFVCACQCVAIVKVIGSSPIVLHKKRTPPHTVMFFLVEASETETLCLNFAERRSARDSRLRSNDRDCKRAALFR